MIPRTKVNYSITQLFRAAFISEKATCQRDALVRALSSLFGMRHILLTPSGRSALFLLLRSLPQKRVVVPAYTCKAVVEAVLLAGKEILYVEVCPKDFNMNLVDLKSVIDSSTVVIATHQFGIPCDIQRICEICSEIGAVVIEDVAAAFGTKVQGRLTGTFSGASFFSFDSTKLINVPLKGGFIATNDSRLFNSLMSVACETLRPMGRRRKYWLLIQAFSLLIIEKPLMYRFFHKVMFEWRGRFTADVPEIKRKMSSFYHDEMTEWQAFFANEQLERLASIIQKRQEIYKRLYEGLNDCVGIILPPPDSGSEWACIRFPIRVKGDKLNFYKKATRKGLDFAFSFTFIAAPECMKESHGIANSILNLPFYHKISDQELSKTIQVIRTLAA